MSKSLKEFWLDKDMKNNVQEYLIEYLKQEAVRKIFEKEDVSSVAEAKEMIDKAFDNMDLLFATQTKDKIITNVAR